MNLDDILQDLKLPPTTMEVPVPRYFKEDNTIALKHRDKIVAGYMKLKLGEERVEVENKGEGATVAMEMSFAAAVEAIQRNERGRQGKQRAMFVKVRTALPRANKMRRERDEPRIRQAETTLSREHDAPPPARSNVIKCFTQALLTLSLLQPRSGYEGR